MPDDAPRPTQVTQELAVPLVYANSTRATGTPWELSIDFAYVAADATSKHGVRVILSWEQAAAVRDLFTKMIARYERELGPVRVFEGEPTVEGESDDAEGGTP